MHEDEHLSSVGHPHCALSSPDTAGQDTGGLWTLPARGTQQQQQQQPPGNSDTQSASASPGDTVVLADGEALQLSWRDGTLYTPLTWTLGGVHAAGTQCAIVADSSQRLRLMACLGEKENSKQV